jgi:predicted nucleic acid-binding protein
MGQTKNRRLGLSEEDAQRMVKALFDTNILIDYLNAVPQARTELQRYTDRAVSIITWMEVMVGASHDLEAATRSFLNGFDVVAVDERIAERAVGLRRSHRIKLPDAVIWATAQVHAMLLVTRNTKDFPANDPGVRVPYSL